MYTFAASQSHKYTNTRQQYTLEYRRSVIKTAMIMPGRPPVKQNYVRSSSWPANYSTHIKASATSCYYKTIDRRSLYVTVYQLWGFSIGYSTVHSRQ